MDFFDLSEYLQYSLIFINLLILIINIYCLITGVIFQTKIRYLATNISLLVLTAVVFFVSVGENFEYRKAGLKNDSYLVESFGRFVPVFIITLVIFGVASLLLLYSVMRWKKECITSASIKEGMDKLPAGLCYHSEKGVPKLINHRMDDLCRMITGEPLFDGIEFWRRLTVGEVLPGNIVEKAGSNPIITVAEASTLSFTKIEREISGEKMFEIRATDITAQYALHLELKQYNDEQRSLNRRLQEYGENVWDITREREILAAKVNIHDMLGKALLVTKRYIENGAVDVTKEELIDMWNGTLYLFDGGFAEKEEENGLDELYKAAKIMGIHLKIVGRIPKDNQVLRFIMSGARECLTNAVHHAHASELVVSLSFGYDCAVIDFTNDGNQPTSPISEGGGLSSLRQSVEASGGTMETKISPHFILRLTIPSKEVY